MKQCNYDEGRAAQFVVNNAVIINSELNFSAQLWLLIRSTG